MAVLLNCWRVAFPEGFIGCIVKWPDYRALCETIQQSNNKAIKHEKLRRKLPSSQPITLPNNKTRKQ
jgi:hypothetical protein